MVEALKIPAHQPTSVGSMLPAPTATKIWLNTRNLDGELVLMGSAPVPIQLALIRTRTVKNAVAYWQVTVPPPPRGPPNSVRGLRQSGRRVVADR